MATTAAITDGDIIIESNHESADQIQLAFAETTDGAKTPGPPTPAEAEPSTEPPLASSADAIAAESTSVVAPEGDVPERLRKKKSTAAVQSAIAKQREAERRADVAEARLEAFTQPAAAAATPQTEPTPDWARLKASPGAPQADQFENYDDYTAALATFVTDARQHQYETRRQQYYEEQNRQEAQAAHATQWQERLAQARTDNPDLDATLDPDVPMSLPMQYLAMESPVGVELLQYLSAHPDDSQRLSTLHPAEVYREMGKIEERLSAASPTSSGPARVISHAKPPIQPLGTSPHTPDANEINEDLSFEEHFKRMNAADRKRGLL